MKMVMMEGDLDDEMISPSKSSGPFVPSESGKSGCHAICLP